MQSPPIVVRDVVIAPASISDRRIDKEADPRLDARLGRAHRQDALGVPHRSAAGEFGDETWKNDSWEYSGNVNVWTNMSADEELGLRLPAARARRRNDYYGGHRPGDNLFAESAGVPRVTTGKRVWHFQIVHHGLWDYDLPAAPNLLDITVDGKTIKAVAQVTKQGFVFVFDRVTGTADVADRGAAGAAADCAGRARGADAAVPDEARAFRPSGCHRDDLVDFTPELRAMAKVAIGEYQDRAALHAAIPARERQAQGRFSGQARRRRELAGSGIDPETGMLYVPSADCVERAAFPTRRIPRLAGRSNIRTARLKRSG